MEIKPLTKEDYELIEKRVEEFNETTERSYYGVDENDVIFSYFKATDDVFLILNDWDEGKNNDPHWNEERDMHSVISFIMDVCTELGRDTSKWS